MKGKKVSESKFVNTIRDICNSQASYYQQAVNIRHYVENHRIE